MIQKSILITGSTGYLGSFLAKKFVNSGYNVYALVRDTSDLSRIQDIANKLEFIYDINELVNRQLDFIVHCATSYGRKGESLNQVYETNLLLPLRLYELASKMENCHFINMDTVLNRNTNSYSLSKKQFLEIAQMNNSVPFTNLQLEHFYGPNDDESKFTTMVVLKCMNNIKSIDLTFGEQKRDFIYIDDLVNAIMMVIINIPLQKNAIPFDEYIIGSGIQVSIREFVEIVHNLTSSTTQLKFGAIPYRVNELMGSQINIEKIKSIGWSPKVSLHEGLTKCIAMYKGEKNV